jgi:hypothetical protein
LLARSAERVVATDILPRALAFLRFNAALNGVGSVEARLGDALEPAAGERFDRIAVHPPFLARPAGQESAVFVHGGERGDELALRMLRAIPPHLAEGGRAVMLADWPLLDEGTVEGRVRAALRASRGTNVLVLQAPAKNLDEHCVQLAAAEHPTLDEAFARAAIAHRDHLESLGVRGLAFGLVVLEPASPEGEGWTSRVSIRHLHDAPVDAEAIDRILEAHRLANGPERTLQQAMLRFPAGVREVEQAMPGGGAPSIIIHPPPGRPEWPCVLTADEARRVRAIATARQVSARASAGEGDHDDVLESARKALKSGILESVTS